PSTQPGSPDTSRIKRTQTLRLEGLTRKRPRAGRESSGLAHAHAAPPRLSLTKAPPHLRNFLPTRKRISGAKVPSGSGGPRSRPSGPRRPETRDAGRSAAGSESASVSGQNRSEAVPVRPFCLRSLHLFPARPAPCQVPTRDVDSRPSRPASPLLAPRGSPGRRALPRPWDSTDASVLLRPPAHPGPPAAWPCRSLPFARSSPAYVNIKPPAACDPYHHTALCPLLLLGPGGPDISVCKSPSPGPLEGFDLGDPKPA
ncbi:hypothetical protein EI555_021476, partial [Monodon monoceros]